MTISIFNNGKEYISATRAGELVGYSGDYVGQLCRAQKIPSKLIGRTWYVELEALENHKRTRQLGKPKSYVNMAKALEALPQESLSFSSSEPEKSTLPSVPAQSLLKYGREEMEFLPSLSKVKRESPGQSSLPSMIKDFSLATLALIAVVMAGVSTIGQVAPGMSYSLGTRMENISEQYVKFFPVGLLGNSLSAFQKSWMGDEELEKPLEIKLTKEEIRFLLMGDSVQ